MPYVEMGQGTYTSIPMLIAEELEIAARPRSARARAAGREALRQPAARRRAGDRRFDRDPASWKPLREAGAIARTLLVTAAAERWKVEPDTCRAEAGEVIHARERSPRLAMASSRLPRRGCRCPRTFR